MSRPLSLKNNYLLPSGAIKVAELLDNYEKGASKEEIKNDVRECDFLDTENIERLVRLLRMTDNVEVNDGKAQIVAHNHTCQGLKTNSFKEWERKAKKENSDFIKNIEG